MLIFLQALICLKPSQKYLIFTEAFTLKTWALVVWLHLDKISSRCYPIIGKTNASASWDQHTFSPTGYDRQDTGRAYLLRIHTLILAHTTQLWYTRWYWPIWHSYDTHADTGSYDTAMIHTLILAHMTQLWYTRWYWPTWHSYDTHGDTGPHDTAMIHTVILAHMTQLWYTRWYLPTWHSYIPVGNFRGRIHYSWWAIVGVSVFIAGH